MPLPSDELLAPISDDSPAGPSIRYDPIYDRIREARREDEELPTGDVPAGPRKVADPKEVVRLATEALATRSKDLQVAAWLTEALVKREGYAGLAGGLELCCELLERFWDGLHPEIEDDDLEMRAAPLAWIATQLNLPIRQVPLDREGHSYLDYEESLSVGYESAAAGNAEKEAQRERKIADGKLPPEAFDKAVDASPPEFYVKLHEDAEAAGAALARLNALASDRFGYDAPNFGPLEETLYQVRQLVKQLHARRVPRVEEPASGAEGAESAEAGDGAAGMASGNGEGGMPAGRGAPSGSGAWLAREPGGPTVLQRAEAELKAGRPRAAVEMLMREAGRTRSRRGRFIRRTQAARILVEAQLYDVAAPLLEELMAEIEERKLEEWEPGELVAEPLYLLWRSLKALDRDDDTRAALYPRVCRLDPVQALGMTPSSPSSSSSSSSSW